jgi:hypothetical protein
MRSPQRGQPSTRAVTYMGPTCNLHCLRADRRNIGSDPFAHRVVFPTDKGQGESDCESDGEGEVRAVSEAL